MNVLVAGGAGFIGSHLIDKLSDDNTIEEIVCVDNLSLGTKKNIEHLHKNNKFVFYNENLCDQQSLDMIMKKHKIKYVFHLAANSDIQASANKPEIEYQNTYSTTFSILQCMRQNDVHNLFFASTSAVYGNKMDCLLDENTPNLRPVSYYGAAKLGCEALLSAYAYMNDMSILTFRFPNVIGPRLTHGVVYDFIKKLKQDSSELKILGDGTQAKPYIYVSDLIDAIMYFKNNKNQDVTLYNIGVEGTTSVKVIADIVCEEMGLKGIPYHFTGGKVGWKGDVPKFQYSLEKVHRAGWKATMNSDESVRKAVKKNL